MKLAWLGTVNQTLSGIALAVGLAGPHAFAQNTSSDGSSWTASGTLGETLISPTATLLQSGKVLLTGGNNVPSSAGPSGAGANVYDPLTGTWSPTGLMGTEQYGLSEQTATLLANGEVLVAGGETFFIPPTGADQAKSELYDPSTNTWSPTGSMSVPRFQHTATLLPSGQVLVAGGYTGVWHTPVASAELYDSATGTWSNTGSMTKARVWAFAALLANGNVLIVGGGDGGVDNTAELYDPTSGAWTLTGSLAFQPTLVTLLGSGRVLASDAQTNASVYDPTSGAWRPTGSMTTARLQPSSAVLPSSKVLVVGGAHDSSAELYDPATGTWSATTSMSAAPTVQTASLLESGQVLVTQAPSYTTTEVYTPAPVVIARAVVPASIEPTGAGCSSTGANTFPRLVLTVLPLLWLSKRNSVAKAIRSRRAV